MLRFFLFFHEPSLHSLSSPDVFLFSLCIVTVSPGSVAGVQSIFCICICSSYQFRRIFHNSLSSDKHHIDCSNCFSFYICSTFGSVKLGRSMRKWEENKWESFFWGAVGIPDVLLPRWFRIFTGFSVIWRGWLFWSMCFLIDLFYVCCAEFED